jgi:choline dehydrogenase-like flavoprotein
MGVFPCIAAAKPDIERRHSELLRRALRSQRSAGAWRHDGTQQAEPNPGVNGRALPVSMGKVLGGGSSINVMYWARGHKNDWN